MSKEENETYFDHVEIAFKWTKNGLPSLVVYKPDFKNGITFMKHFRGEEALELYNKLTGITVGWMNVEGEKENG